ncbi:MAG: acyl-homoserine-lactone synthase [Burkholderiales bacterium]
MYHTAIGTLADSAFAARYAEPFFRLRYEAFYRRLHWDVQCRDEREIDKYDDQDTVYVVTSDDTGKVVGGWRLRPTLTPYMLDEVFSQLLHGTAAPHDERVWESNRFVVDQHELKARRFGFNQAAQQLFRATAQYAVDTGIDEYVMVLSAGVVRLVRNSGLIVHQYGPPVRIGDVLSVGCRIVIDAHTRHVLLGEPAPLEKAA